MKNQKLNSTQNIQIVEQVQRFYTQRPYPRPIEELGRSPDNDNRRSDFHLHFPHKSYQEDLKILIAGCGTSQAAKYAFQNPLSKVVGIDFSKTSIAHTQKLKHKYKLTNLETHQLPIERVNELGSHFDKIVCTGVLHHLPDPHAGLCSLKNVLEPDGSLHLMVYATYGRIGVYMLQEYAQRLEVGDTDQEISDFANTLMELPQTHPLARLLGESPDFRSKAGLADALLNPQDRSYTVPQLLQWITEAGLRFGRWVRQAPYLPQCSPFVQTPHRLRLMQLPEYEQYAAIELLRGTMLRHNLIVYHPHDSGGDTRSNEGSQIHFQGNEWLDYIPIRLPETVCVNDRLPPGAEAVLINQSHTDSDIYLSIDGVEKRLYDAIDGKRSIINILENIMTDHESARRFFERLWRYDQVVFDASNWRNLDGF